jgi:formylmethanofuran dehydrogenase subunit E
MVSISVKSVFIDYKGGSMKVDGIEIEWWNKDKFRNRTIEVLSPNSPKTVIDVQDDDILCDCCNSEIAEFPVAVWDGMAYCKDCYDRYLKPNIK